MRKLTFLLALLCVSVMGFAIDWNGIGWVADGLQGGALNKTYKVSPSSENASYPAVVNIQDAGSAEKTGIYVTFPNGIVSCSLTSYGVQGGGLWMSLSNFSNQETPVEVTTDASITYHFAVYYENGTPGGSCTDETAPTVTAVAKSDITHNSIVLTVTAADNDGGTGIASYIVKNGDTQIASSATSPITVTGLTAGTTYNNIKVITKDGCNNESSAFDVESFTTLNRPSECSGDLGHWATPATKRISYTIEYVPVIDKIKYTVQGYGSEVLNYLEIRTASPAVANSGSVGIVDGVATWFQNAPAAGTEMAVQFYYGVESIGGGREITQDGEVSLSNPQSVYYKSHDCAVASGPSTVPAGPDDKNDCQVFSIFGTEGFVTNATHAEAWDGAKSFLTGKIDGKDAYFTTAGTTANIQYPSKNINEYDKLHFDIWTDAAREIGVELCINAGTHGTKQNITTTAGAWKSVELDITGFHDPKDVNTTFLFFSSLARETYYLANVYLYKTADDESCYESLNIALKKPVVAGYTPSDPGEVPSKANDGNEGSEWTTWANRPASEEWWYVDLLHVYNLTNISILWGGDYSTNYILQTRIEEPTVADRANDEAWTTVATVTDATASAVKSNNITAAGRYVRIHSLARSNVNLIRMKEFRVFGSGFADIDTEKPVMTSATLESKTNNQVVINVAATDNKGIASYHVVETTHSINESLSAEEGKITITGLTAATEYSFVITAVDFFGNESANNKVVNVTTDAHLTAPAAAAADPTWPSDQVISFYSDSYTAPATWEFRAPWGGTTAKTNPDPAIGENHMLHYTAFDFAGWYITSGEPYDALTMEKLHLDIWVENDGSLGVVPIYGGADLSTDDNHRKTINLSGQIWNSIDLDLQTDFAGLNFSSIFQFKLDNSTVNEVYVDNVYFYRTTPPATDEYAPTDVTASVIEERYASVNLSAQANDDSGVVHFKVLNGSSELVSDVLTASGSAITISLTGLTPNTNYNFSVIAFDEAGHEAEPVMVAASTKALPPAAPKPTHDAVAVLSVYSEYTPAVAASFNKSNWGSAPVEIESNYILYAMRSNVIVWGNNDGNAGHGNIDGVSGHTHGTTPGLDVSGMKYIHFDVWCDVADQLNTVNINDQAVSIPTARTIAGEWVSFDVDITGVALADRQNVRWLKFHPFSTTNCNVAIDNVYFYKDPELVRDDDWMAPGELGTICIPQGAVATGGNLYELVGMNDIGKIIFATVPDNEMEPGKPYLFEAKSNAMKFYYTEETPAVEPDNSGAMKGSFTSYTLYDLDNVYYFAGHALWSCDDLKELNVIANRAYVKLDEVVEISPAPVPGRRFVYMDVHGPNTTTGVDELNASETPVKVIIDGKLFILRGEKMYDVTGSLVK